MWESRKDLGGNIIEVTKEYTWICPVCNKEVSMYSSWCNHRIKTTMTADTVGKENNLGGK